MIHFAVGSINSIIIYLLRQLQAKETKHLSKGREKCIHEGKVEEGNLDIKTTVRWNCYVHFCKP